MAARLTHGRKFELLAMDMATFEYSESISYSKAVLRRKEIQADASDNQRAASRQGRTRRRERTSERASGRGRARRQLHFGSRDSDGESGGRKDGRGRSERVRGEVNRSPLHRIPLLTNIRPTGKSGALFRIFMEDRKVGKFSTKCHFNCRS